MLAKSQVYYSVYKSSLLLENKILIFFLTWSEHLSEMWMALTFTHSQHYGLLISDFWKSAEDTGIIRVTLTVEYISHNCKTLKFQ